MFSWKLFGSSCREENLHLSRREDRCWGFTTECKCDLFPVKVHLLLNGFVVSIFISARSNQYGWCMNFFATLPFNSSFTSLLIRKRREQNSKRNNSGRFGYFFRNDAAAWIELSSCVWFRILRINQSWTFLVWIKFLLLRSYTYGPTHTHTNTQTVVSK